MLEQTFTSRPIGEDKDMGMRRFLQSLRKSCTTLFATVARPNDGELLSVDIGLRIILMTRAVLWSKISLRMTMFSLKDWFRGLCLE
jgi:hypothetical protein